MAGGGRPACPGPSGRLAEAGQECGHCCYTAASDRREPVTAAAHDGRAEALAD